MIKNLRESDVRVRLIDDTLDVSCSLANGNLFKLHFNLFKPIYVTESSWSVTPSKLEVKLKKTDRKRWQSLETIPEKGAKRTPAVAGIVEANSPTAKKFGKFVWLARMFASSIISQSLCERAIFCMFVFCYPITVFG